MAVVACPAQVPTRNSVPRIPQLDGLRGLAILLVIGYHYISMPGADAAGVFQVFAWCLRLGWAGVDLFFVLSGFLIGGILIDARESPNYFRTFYVRRVLRILPLYAVLLALFCAGSRIETLHAHPLFAPPCRPGHTRPSPRTWPWFSMPVPRLASTSSSSGRC